MEREEERGAKEKSEGEERNELVKNGKGRGKRAKEKSEGKERNEEQQEKRDEQGNRHRHKRNQVNKK